MFPRTTLLGVGFSRGGLRVLAQVSVLSACVECGGYYVDIGLTCFARDERSARYNVESVSEKLLVISGRLIGEMFDQRVEESKSWDMTEVSFARQGPLAIIPSKRLAENYWVCIDGSCFMHLLLVQVQRIGQPGQRLRRHRRGDEAKIQGIFLLLLFTMLFFQMGLHAWKQKYPVSYTRVTLAGM